MTTQQKKLNICLVDDEADVADSFASNLRTNYDVTTFQSAKDALTAIDDGLKPDILISDLRMPDMDGHTFIEHVKSKGLDSKVIITSGHSNKADALRSINNGVFGFLEKPVTTKELKDMVVKASQSVDDSKYFWGLLNLYEEFVTQWDLLSQVYYDRLVMIEDDEFNSSQEKMKYIKSLQEERQIRHKIEKFKCSITSAMDQLASRHPWLNN